MHRFCRLLYQNHVYPALQETEGYRLISANPWEPWETLPGILASHDIQLLAPVVPSKIVAVGLNYRSHALELNMPLPQEPLIFLKPPTALANPGQEVVWPKNSERVDFEGELALVICRTAKNVPWQASKNYILGFTLANDITARDLQKKDGQWTRAKGFDGFCPLGPVVVTELDEKSFELQTWINHTMVQSGKLSDLIFPIPRIVEFVSHVMTLLPGDVILTGTPPGVGPFTVGDQVRVVGDGIGVLENKMVRE